MEYSIHELAVLAGISTRTLRYYDQIDLLKPSRMGESGYRFYGKEEVELLQQILFFRERKIPLARIRELLRSPGFDQMAAMEEHLAALRREQDKLAQLIETVEKTIAEMKGEVIMQDSEKFAAWKRESIEENEKKYGEEIRERYGDGTVDASNRKLFHMTEEQYGRFQELEKQIISRLEQAVLQGVSPDSREGREIALLHGEWLQYTWNAYTKEAHEGLTKMYLADERFLAYYDSKVKGCATFLAAAVKAM